jgi:hypothetical protein
MKAVNKQLNAKRKKEKEKDLLEEKKPETFQPAKASALRPVTLKTKNITTVKKQIKKVKRKKEEKDLLEEKKLDTFQPTKESALRRVTLQKKKRTAKERGRDQLIEKLIREVLKKDPKADELSILRRISIKLEIRTDDLIHLKVKGQSVLDYISEIVDRKKRFEVVEEPERRRKQKSSSRNYIEEDDYIEEDEDDEKADYVEDEDDKKAEDELEEDEDNLTAEQELEDEDELEDEEELTEELDDDAVSRHKSVVSRMKDDIFTKKMQYKTQFESGVEKKKVKLLEGTGGKRLKEWKELVKNYTLKEKRISTLRYVGGREKVGTKDPLNYIEEAFRPKEYIAHSYKYNANNCFIDFETRLWLNGFKQTWIRPLENEGTKFLSETRFGFGGKMYHLPNKRWIAMQCNAFSSRRTQTGLVFTCFENGIPYSFNVIHELINKKFVEQDEDLFKQEKDWLRYKYDTTFNIIKSLERNRIDENTRVLIRDHLEGVIRKSLNQVIVNEDKSKQQANELELMIYSSHAAMAQDDNNKPEEYYREIAKVCALLDTDLFGSYALKFRFNLHNERLSIDKVPEVSVTELIPELFANPEFSDDKKAELLVTFSNTMNIYANNLVIMVANAKYSMLAVRKYISDESVETLKETYPVQSVLDSLCVNGNVKNNNPDIINYADPATGQVYCFNYDNLLDRVKRGDIFNPITGSRFSEEFLEYLSAFVKIPEYQQVEKQEDLTYDELASFDLDKVVNEEIDLLLLSLQIPLSEQEEIQIKDQALEEEYEDEVARQIELQTVESDSEYEELQSSTSGVESEDKEEESEDKEEESESEEEEESESEEEEESESEEEEESESESESEEEESRRQKLLGCVVCGKDVTVRSIKSTGEPVGFCSTKCLEKYDFNKK